MRITPLKKPSPPPRGFTMLEFVVAMVVLGIALLGMFPLIVMQHKTFRRMAVEVGVAKYYYDAVNTADEDSVTWEQESLFITPYTYLFNTVAGWIPWARKLGVGPLLTLPDNHNSSGVTLPDPAILSIANADDLSKYYVQHNATSEGAWTSDLCREAVTENTLHAVSAQWTFSNVPRGNYYLWLKWTTPTDKGASATFNHSVYTIVAGTASYATSAVDQSVTPTDWTKLGPYAFTDQSTSTVRIYLDANVKSISTAYVVGGYMKLVPKYTVSANAAPSCVKTADGWTASVVVTATESK